jgi:hypothetical protein
MTVKNIITVLGIAVAVAAFIVSNIWAQNLHEKVDSARRATDAWTATYNSVNREEIAMRGVLPADAAAADRRVEKTLGLVREVDHASTSFTQAEVVNSDEIDGSIAMTRQSMDLGDRLRKPHSLDETAVLDKQAIALLEKVEGLGVLMDSEVMEWNDELQKRESSIKYIGYTLSILAIIVAGVALLAGKGPQ